MVKGNKSLKCVVCFEYKAILFVTDWLYLGSTRVEHSTQQLKARGSNPATGNGRENMAKMLFMSNNTKLSYSSYSSRAVSSMHDISTLFASGVNY